MNTSDLIVVGTFSLHEIDSSASTIMVNGTVTAAEILWGDVFSFLTGEVVGEDEIPVSWRVLPDGSNPVDLATADGLEGIWLLVETETDTYRADGPRYLALRNRSEVVRVLQQNRVIVRHTLYNPPSGTMVDLLFRNARTSDAVVPDFSLSAGVLRLHPDVSLSVYQTGADGKPIGEPLQPFDGRILYLDEEDWTVVGSGEEHLVRLNLADFFDLNRQTSYIVEFHVAGFGTSMLMLPADMP